MSEKKPLDFRSAFDDRSLPINTLSAERAEEIEKILMPRMLERLEKLRLEKPHLFKSPEKPVLYSDLETKRKADPRSKDVQK
jgi:DNA-binding TFAR19-related protein (PDSD5 family)